jgi:ribonucleoside-diphosphate reductase alpha chain
MRGLMNAFATAISIGLQYGVPLEDFVRKFSYMRFEPEGITTNPEIPFAKSMPDYIMRWLASRFIEDTDELEDLGILTPEVRAKPSRDPSWTDTAGRQRRNGERLRRHGQRGRTAAAARPPPRPHRNPPGGPGQDAGPSSARLRAVRRHDAAHGLLLHAARAAATTPAAAELSRELRGVVTRVLGDRAAERAPRALG